MNASLLCDVVTELQQPHLGVLGPLVPRLASMKREQTTIIDGHPWTTEDAASLVEILDCYVDMTTSIDRLMAPILHEQAIHDEDGDVGRFLFQFAVLYLHRATPEPVALLVPVVSLAAAGPHAERELIRRLRAMATAAPASKRSTDGHGILLVAAARILAAREDAQQAALRVVPGLDLETIAAFREQSLSLMVRAVLAKLRSQGRYPFFKARLRHESVGERVTRDDEEHAAKCSILRHALDKEWRRLNVNELLGRALDRTLRADLTLANRNIDEQKALAKRDVEDPDHPKDKVHREPARVTIEQAWDSDRITFEIRDEQDVARPASLFDALIFADMRDVERAIRVVLERDPARRLGCEILCAEILDGESLKAQAARRGRTRQTLAKYRDECLRDVRAELGLPVDL